MDFGLIFIRRSEIRMILLLCNCTATVSNNKFTILTYKMMVSLLIPEAPKWPRKSVTAVLKLS